MPNRSEGNVQPEGGGGTTAQAMLTLETFVLRRPLGSSRGMINLEAGEIKSTCDMNAESV